MRTRTTLFVALAAVGALVLGGSAARAIPSAPGAGPRPGPRPSEATARAELKAGRVAFRPVSGKGFPDPRFRAKKKVSPSNDSLGRLPGEGFAAYATGTVLHSDPELSESGELVTVDMAVADAVYSAQALSAFTDELGRPLVAGLPALSGLSHARAVKIDPPDVLELGVDMGEPADAKAPPISRPVVRETAGTDLEPVLKADLLRAEAAARAVTTGCVIGDDLARAMASADDTEVGDTDFDPGKSKPLLSLNVDDARAVSSSATRTYLEPIPDRPGRFAAVSEVRQTIAPVTFGLPETGEKFTIEVGGEWVMRAWTDGFRGSITLGPENSDDYDRHAVRLFRGEELVGVDLAELSGGERTGIFVDGQPIGDIRIGGEERAISGPPESRATETGTRVAAASDVVVVRLFESESELRIGHMEVALAVPPGGVKCPGIALSKTSDPATIRPGDSFTWNIDVFNPNDCVLDRIRVVDSPTASRGVDWQALTSVPRATRAPNGDLVFDNIGAVQTGETRTLQLNAQVDPESDLGSITNRASAVGSCGEAPMVGGAETTTNVGMAIVPALPRPPAGIAASERPDDRRGSAGSGSGTASGGSGGSGGGANTSSAALSRSAKGSSGSASATRAASAATKRAAGASVSGQRQNAPAATAAAAPLARSGADTLPYAALGVALLGAGRLMRLAKTRRRS